MAHGPAWKYRPEAGEGCGDLVITMDEATWQSWLSEDSPFGPEHVVVVGSDPPEVGPGGRVYVVVDGRLRGYVPLARLDRVQPDGVAVVGRSWAVPVSINELIEDFQGWRYRWWPRARERFAAA